MPTLPDGFHSHPLGDGCVLHSGRLPDDLVWGEDEFNAVWELHPQERHWIKILGRQVQTPRWQQAYGTTYSYSGSDNTALPIPACLAPLLHWSRQQFDERLNGLLLNWYDGPADYIGPHHDSTTNRIVGSPIVTISYGEERLFRLTAGRGPTGRRHDFPAPHGTVFVTPWQTNHAWKHSVPKRAHYSGRRISVTLRAFKNPCL